MKTIKRVVITILFILLATYQIDVHKKLLRHNVFTKQQLEFYIYCVQIEYPEIVMAQARLESGNFNSKLFRGTHNLFGMGKSTKRLSCAVGAKNGFNVYLNWKASVMDYKLWQDRIIHHLPNEKSYLLYIQRYYAQDKQYVSLIKKIIKHG